MRKSVFVKVTDGRTAMFDFLIRADATEMVVLDHTPGSTLAVPATAKRYALDEPIGCVGDLRFFRLGPDEFAIVHKTEPVSVAYITQLVMNGFSTDASPDVDVMSILNMHTQTVEQMLAGIDLLALE